MNKYEGDMPEATVEIGTDVGGKSKWTGDEVAAKQSALERAGDGVNGAITGFFYSTGLSIGRNPRKWAFATFFVAVIFGAGIGFPGITNESRGDKLWVPRPTLRRRTTSSTSTSTTAPRLVLARSSSNPRTAATRSAPPSSTLWPPSSPASRPPPSSGRAPPSLGRISASVGTACVMSHINQAFAAATDRDTVAEIFAKVNAAPTSVVTGQSINLDAVLGGGELRRAGRRRRGAPRRFLDQDPSDDRERRRAGSSRRRVRARTLGSVQRGRRRGGSVLHRAAFLR